MRTIPLTEIEETFICLDQFNRPLLPYLADNETLMSLYISKESLRDLFDDDKTAALHDLTQEYYEMFDGLNFDIEYNRLEDLDLSEDELEEALYDLEAEIDEVTTKAQLAAIKLRTEMMYRWLLESLGREQYRRIKTWAVYRHRVILVVRGA